jgi:8-oxo-dGTP pyrophosphatase MutT (NUDIX family)
LPYNWRVSKESHEQRLARWAKSGKPGSEPVPAATVIPIRDGPDGLETLMLRRNSKIAFGGMWVFPGGRVDPDDRDPDQPDDELATARRTAVREVHEEAGLEIAADVLLPYSHWTPPPIAPRRFLTWFFLAPAPGGDVVIDDGEIREHRWLRPSEALDRQRAGEIELVPPTYVTLYELSSWRSVSESLEAVRAREPEHFATRIAVEDDGPTVMWHGDAGYTSGDTDAPGPRHRLRMHASGWFYERTA